MSKPRLHSAFLFLLASGPFVAQAHIRLDVPKARSTPNLKMGPCGASTPGTPQEIDGWVAGATVTIEYTETIDHPSHYRVALSREGDSAFVDPVNADDKTTDGNELLDGIADLNEGMNRKGTIEVVLPGEPCESCVLQLMQIMYDKPSMPFYYQCADVVIGPGENSSGSGGQSGTGGQDAAGGAEASGGASVGSGGAVGSGGSSGGAAAGSGGSISASGGAASGVGGASGGASGGSWAAGGGDASGSGGDLGDDGSMSPAGGGCSMSRGPTSPGLLGLLGLGALFGLLARRGRVRAAPIEPRS